MSAEHRAIYETIVRHGVVMKVIHPSMGDGDGVPTAPSVIRKRAEATQEQFDRAQEFERQKRADKQNQDEKDREAKRQKAQEQKDYEAIHPSAKEKRLKDEQSTREAEAKTQGADASNPPPGKHEETQGEFNERARRNIAQSRKEPEQPKKASRLGPEDQRKLHETEDAGAARLIRIKNAKTASDADNAPPNGRLHKGGKIPSLFADPFSGNKFLQNFDNIIVTKAKVVSLGGQEVSIEDATGQIVALFTKALESQDRLLDTCKKQYSDLEQQCSDQFCLSSADRAGIDLVAAKVDTWDRLKDVGNRLTKTRGLLQKHQFAKTHREFWFALSHLQYASKKIDETAQTLIKGADQVVTDLHNIETACTTLLSILSKVTPVGSVVSLAIAVMPAGLEMIEQREFKVTKLMGAVIVALVLKVVGKKVEKMMSMWIINQLPKELLLKNPLSDEQIAKAVEYAAKFGAEMIKASLKVSADKACAKHDGKTVEKEGFCEEVMKDGLRDFFKEMTAECIKAVAGIKGE